MSATNEQIYETLGALGERVGSIKDDIHGLRSAVDKVERQGHDREMRASEARKVLYSKVDDLNKEVAGVKHRLEANEAVLGDVRQVTDDLTKTDQRRKGAFRLLGGLSLAGGVTAFWEKIVMFFKGF